MNVKSAVAAGLLLVSAQGLATPLNTATTNMTITATVATACSIAAGTLDFGQVNPLATDVVKNNGQITVTCTNGTQYAVALDAGKGAGATTSTRKMTNTNAAVTANNTLNYNLYRDPNLTQNWGNTSDTYAGTGSGVAQQLPVYGSVPTGQVPVPGSYSDTVTVVVSYGAGGLN